MIRNNKRSRPSSFLSLPTEPDAKSRKGTRNVFIARSAERKASPVDYGACAFTPGGIRTIKDRDNTIWIKSSKRSISIPVFQSQVPLTFTEVKSPKNLNPRVQSGQAISFGKNNEIVITDTLSSGQDGVVFQGFYAGIKHKVVLKIPTKPIAHHSANSECAPVSSEEEQSDFEDALREYDIMSTVKCGRGEGPIVCALGASGITLGGKIYIVIALEFMDTTSLKYINTIEKTSGKEAAAKQAALVLMKALANIKALHSIGIMHMDAHVDNWLIKYKGLAPMRVDVRMVDLGRSCSANKPGSIDDCKAIAANAKDMIYTDYMFFGLIEFIQFIGFACEILTIVMRHLPREVHSMIFTIRNMYQKYSDYFYNYRMSAIPQNIANMPFEYFIEESKLNVLLNVLAKSPTLFTTAETAQLASEGLIPQ